MNKTYFLKLTVCFSVGGKDFREPLSWLGEAENPVEALELATKELNIGINKKSGLEIDKDYILEDIKIIG